MSGAWCVVRSELFVRQWVVRTEVSVTSFGSETHHAPRITHHSSDFQLMLD
jgi:hypothetical protein